MIQIIRVIITIVAITIFFVCLTGSGITIGISSRGMGSVSDNLSEGTVEVQDDYDLLCFDFVSTPSTHGAFMKPVNESVKVGSLKSYKKINTLVRDIICEIDGICAI